MFGSDTVLKMRAASLSLALNGEPLANLVLTSTGDGNSRAIALSNGSRPTDLLPEVASTGKSFCSRTPWRRTLASSSEVMSSPSRYLLIKSSSSSHALSTSISRSWSMVPCSAAGASCGDSLPTR
jgi:hypothetical protein